VLVSRREVVQGAALLLAPPWIASDLVQPSAAIAASPKPELVPLTLEQKATLEKVLGKVVSKVKAPVLLRMAFHDAATYRLFDGQGGPNASVQFELDRPENIGLKRGWSNVVEVSLMQVLGCMHSIFPGS
jgi:L-ascorbate peroxidase